MRNRHQNCLKFLYFLQISTLLLCKTTSFAQNTKTPETMLQEISESWVGQYDNHRQVANNISLGDQITPEMTLEKREMRVVKLDAPQFGEVVLYLEEFRETNPTVAHRQRVMGLIFDKDQKKIRVKQFFFKTGGTYDRKPLAASIVEKMPLESFDYIDKCDLFIDFEAKNNRYRGSMLCKTCIYDHPTDGKVYAEYDMLLFRNQLWYRDRSMKLADGCIRGEIDGFSWLRFDKKAPNLVQETEFERRFPSLSKQIGTWEGKFRRIDSDGKLTADFASKITVKIDFSNLEKPYHQTNFYTFADGKTQKIESSGSIERDKLIFSNEQIEGYAAEISADPTQRSSMFYMKYKDGSGMYVYEIVTLSDDGRSRSRATQYLKDGKIVRRTLIDEVKVE